MFRSVGWKMATIGPVPWETSGAGHRYITYILWLLFMWPSLSVLLAKWIIAHIVTYLLPTNVYHSLSCVGDLWLSSERPPPHFLFVLWVYTGGLSSWNLLLFMCLCNHRHFKIISLQFHEMFPFLATGTLILLWVIAIKLFICLIKIEDVGFELYSTTVLWFEIHWLKISSVSPATTSYENRSVSRFNRCKSCYGFANQTVS